MTKLVLVTGNSVADRYIDQLESEGFKVKNPQHFLEADELIQELQGCTYHLCGGDEKLTDEVMKKAPDLKHYAFLGVGYSSFVDEDAATSNGIAITKTPGTLTKTVAEFVVGLLLASNRNIVALNNRVKSGSSEAEKVTDVEGKTIGILGMGEIGTEVARKLHLGFDAKIIYHNRHVRSELPDGLSAEYVGLTELLENSDFLVVTVDGDPKNYDMIGEAEISKMKPGIQIISIARAAIISPKPLLAALKSGAVRSYVLDGYYVEPIPSPKDDKLGFLDLPDDQFLITPHIASLTHNARDRMSEMCVASILKFDATGDDEFVVNPGFKKTAR